MDQITTITFFRFPSRATRWWGLRMMQDAHAFLSDVYGQSFYKLMGSGRQGGFNPLPDWSVYALLQVWNNEAAADSFLQRSEIIESYRHRSSQVWTIYLRNISSKGAWSGENPFQSSADLDPENKKLAVITRARIRFRYLIPFWRYVPASRRGLHANPGLIYSKGIGEVPVLQMATFSLWEDEHSLRTFAYEGRGHRKAIEKTRKSGWFSEELFARFQPYRYEGSWEGVKPA